MSGGRAADRSVRVGLVGCGRVATMFHLGLLLRLDGCELAALVDSDAERLELARAVAPAARGFGRLDEMLSDADVDAVVLTLPTDLHAGAAAAAFDHGKHVYVEKPLATSTEEARPAVAAWRRAGTVGAVGYPFRFHPSARALKTALEQGEVGELVAVRTSFGAAARDLPDWKRSRATGGGALLDLASHHVDLLRFLFEREIVEVCASIRSVRSEDDSALVELTLADDVPVQMIASAAAVQEDAIEVYGTAGKLTADRFASRALVRTPTTRPARLPDRLRATATGARRLRDVALPPSEPSFAASLTAFLQAIRGYPFDGATLGDGYRALEVVEAAETSARTGRRVHVPAAQAP